MTFCVWRAIPLMRNRGEPSGVSAYGMTEATGKPGCSAECVASVPMRSVSRSVRTRSAKVGSGAVEGGRVGGGEGVACCVMGWGDFTSRKGAGFESFRNMRLLDGQLVLAA